MASILNGNDEGTEEPAEIEAIHRRLAQPGLSLALTEATVMSKAFPIMAPPTFPPRRTFLKDLKHLTEQTTSNV